MEEKKNDNNFNAKKKPNEPAKKKSWDEKVFSESCIKILMLINENGADLIQLLGHISTIHSDYGNLSYSASENQSKTDTRPLQRLIDFLVQQRGSRNFVVYQSGEWAGEVTSIMLVPNTPPVINGRMFLIAVLLSQYPVIYNILYEKSLWQQQCSNLINILDKELQSTIPGFDYKLWLTEKGHQLLKGLNDNASIGTPTESFDTLIDSANLSDAPTNKDSLSRNALAQYLANRIKHIYNRDIAKGTFGSFFMHIDGAWGSGKSTLLSFIKNQLEHKNKPDKSQQDVLLSEKQWIVVDFNAWEYQRLNPPWWFLMQAFYNTARRRLWRSDILRWVSLVTHELAWRINTGTGNLIAVIVTCLLFLWATKLSLQSGEEIKNLPIAQAVTFIGFLWSLTRFLRTGLVPGSAKAARSFIDENSKDPLQILTRHFASQIRRTGRPVAIFIDDLDRCNREFGVKLLEGLQTIFKQAPIVYVVAADQRWLCKMYEDQYSSFASAIASPAKPFGLVFLDKTFQLTLKLPDISAEQKKIYWDDLLQIVPNDTTESKEAIKSEVDQKLREAPTNQQKMNIVNETGDSPKKQQIIREQIVSSLSIIEEENLLEHTLQKYIDLIEPNPRAMKRLINDISTAMAISFLYHQQINQEQLILWTILKLQYPSLAEHFWYHPEQLKDVYGYTEARKPVTKIPDFDALLLKHEVQRLFHYGNNGQVTELNSDFLRKMKFQVSE